MSTIPTDELVERAAGFYDKATIEELVENEDYETLHVAAYLTEFKSLVRKYASQDDFTLLTRMQELTSIYSPWIWSD